MIRRVPPPARSPHQDDAAVLAYHRHWHKRQSFTGTVAEFARRVVEDQGANSANAKSIDEGQSIVLAGVEKKFADGSASISMKSCPSWCRCRTPMPPMPGSSRPSANCSTPCCVSEGQKSHDHPSLHARNYGMQINTLRLVDQKSSMDELQRQLATGSNPTAMPGSGSAVLPRWKSARSWP